MRKIDSFLFGDLQSKPEKKTVAISGYYKLNSNFNPIAVEVLPDCNAIQVKLQCNPDEVAPQSGSNCSAIEFMKKSAFQKSA